MDEFSYSGWMTTEQAAAFLGFKSIRRIQQLYHEGRLRGVMIGARGTVYEIWNDHGKRKVVKRECRGASVLRLDPESVFSFQDVLKRQRAKRAENRARRDAQRRVWFESHVQYNSRGERDYRYHDEYESKHDYEHHDEYEDDL